MALDYVKIFLHLKYNIILVGRNEKKRHYIENKFPNIKFVSGGIKKYFENTDNVPNFVINAVDIINLYDVSKSLIENGIKNILIEKPGALRIEHLTDLCHLKRLHSTNVYIGYNRRFYNSVIKLKELIKLDGGIKNVHFEFTEWINTINPDIYPDETLNKWIYSNSSHVIDLVFSIIGNPFNFDSKIYGENLISWHKHASIFTGMGITDNNILFTYNSNWCGPGRWGIEFTTTKNRYILKPLEKLFIQEINSVNLNEYIINDPDDSNFKPGLYKQVKSFLNADEFNLVSLEYQISNFKLFNKIGGY
jgi:predicted dehydrogenase